MRDIKYLKVGLILLIIGTCLGIVVISFIHGLSNEYLLGAGEVEFYPDDGGFYGIISDDGTHYEPINLPDEFKIDGLQVLFIFKLPNDSTSYHLWLRIVEIFDIIVAPF
jgi:hypothetical protein